MSALCFEGVSALWRASAIINGQAALNKILLKYHNLPKSVDFFPSFMPSLYSVAAPLTQLMGALIYIRPRRLGMRTDRCLEKKQYHNKMPAGKKKLYKSYRIKYFKPFTRVRV
eukprot:Platyproteum_vivax@DN10760_c0_g1_i1.p1